MSNHFLATPETLPYPLHRHAAQVEQRHGVHLSLPLNYSFLILYYFWGGKNYVKAIPTRSKRARCRKVRGEADRLAAQLVIKI